MIIYLSIYPVIVFCLSYIDAAYIVKVPRSALRRNMPIVMYNGRPMRVMRQRHIIRDHNVDYSYNTAAIPEVLPNEVPALRVDNSAVTHAYDITTVLATTTIPPVTTTTRNPINIYDLKKAFEALEKKLLTTTTTTTETSPPKSSKEQFLSCYKESLLREALKPAVKEDLIKAFATPEPVDTSKESTAEDKNNTQISDTKSNVGSLGSLLMQLRDKLKETSENDNFKWIKIKIPKSSV